jgi:hypothetical protein
MIIERTESEIIIRVSSKVDTTGLQRLVDYLKYQELTLTSGAIQADVDTLAREVNKHGGTKQNLRYLPVV